MEGGSSLTPQGATKAEARWLGASMKGRRRTCSPFEMLFKKSLLKAATVGDTTTKVGGCMVYFRGNAHKMGQGQCSIVT